MPDKTSLSSENDWIARSKRATHSRTALSDPQALSASEVQASALLTPQRLMTLQRTIGNRAVQSIIQPPDALKEATRRPTMTYRPATVSRKHIQRTRLGNYIKNQAKEATLGDNDDRRDTGMARNEVQSSNKFAFSAVQDVSITHGEDTLKGYHYLPVPSKTSTPKKYEGYTVLVLTGSAGSAEVQGLPIAQSYCLQGASVLSVNYAGFGSSTRKAQGGGDRQLDFKEITTDLLYSSAKAIFDWLIGTGVNSSQVIIHGYSLGGAMASHLVAELSKANTPIGGLVMHSPIDDVVTQGNASMPVIGAIGGAMSGLKLDSNSNLKQIARNPAYRNMMIHFISGKGKNSSKQADHLALEKTKMNKKAKKMGFTNVTSVEKDKSGHFDTANHMYEAVNTNSDGLDRMFPALPPQQTAQPQSQQSTSDTLPQTSDIGMDQTNEVETPETQIEAVEATPQEEQVIQEAFAPSNKVKNLTQFFEQLAMQ